MFAAGYERRLGGGHQVARPLQRVRHALGRDDRRGARGDTLAGGDLLRDAVDGDFALRDDEAGAGGIRIDGEMGAGGAELAPGGLDDEARGIVAGRLQDRSAPFAR